MKESESLKSQNTELQREIEDLQRKLTDSKEKLTELNQSFEELVEVHVYTWYSTCLLINILFSTNMYIRIEIKNTLQKMCSM